MDREHEQQAAVPVPVPAAAAASAAKEEEKTKKKKFRRVCVFCGSSPGKRSSYQAAAVQLGQQLVERGMDLVYGGGSVGLMSLVSRAVHDGGGHVLGVVPKAVLKPVAGMHQRKAEMARHSDAFIALPGGYGTLEELLEVIAWAQLGIHTKPVGLLNVDGYYDPLLAFVDKAVQEGFDRHPRRTRHHRRRAHATRPPRQRRLFIGAGPHRLASSR